jgi:hypothetical protein
MAPATEKPFPAPVVGLGAANMSALYLRLVNLGAANMPTPAPVLVLLERPVRQMSCRGAARPVVRPCW